MNQAKTKKFTSWSTASEVLNGKNFINKVALITGSNSGIGLETAKSLARYGCEIIFACRNEESTLKIIESLKTEIGEHSKLNFIQVDLAKMRSCKRFCDDVKRQYSHIDYLILNAGVFGIPYELTEDGIEKTFQVCHLSHFYMTLTLSELMNDKSRVVIVGSESHRFSNFPSRGLTHGMLSVKPSKYWVVHAYNNVKLCNTIFAFELSRRWKSRGISVFVVHPGNLVWTDIHRYSWLCRLLFLSVYPFTKSLQQAAATSVYCATAEELNGITGKYFNNCNVCEPSVKSQSEKLGKDLWELSEKMIDEIFKKI